MAGHSHSKNIMHRKNAVDAKRGKVFSKLAKNIISAARQGADPAMNLPLKYAVEKAKQANMPKDNIERAIKRGSGQLGGQALEEIVYEGFGPSGTALIIESCTDNKNRIAPLLRSTLDRAGGNLGNPGSVSWMFKHCAYFVISQESCDEEALTELILEHGGDDLSVEDEHFHVSGPPDAFSQLVQAFEKAGIATEQGGLVWMSENSVAIEDVETAKKVSKLIETLEDQDDVTAVYCNWEVSQEILDQI